MPVVAAGDGYVPYAETPVDKVISASCKTPLILSRLSFDSNSQRICLQHLLAKNPQARFANATNFLNAFQIAFDSPVPTPSPAKRSPASQRFRRQPFLPHHYRTAVTGPSPPAAKAASLQRDNIKPPEKSGSEKHQNQNPSDFEPMNRFRPRPALPKKNVLNSCLQFRRARKKMFDLPNDRQLLRLPTAAQRST